MTSFTTRIVLNDANWEDYENLHEYMADEGFTRTITSDEKVTYKLPDAEYNYDGTINRSDVVDKAKAAAAKTQRKYSVLVTQSAGRSWVDLERDS